MTARCPTDSGSLTVDDEGTPTNRTVLIEDGILVNLLQDRLNARLMHMKAHRQWPAPVARPCANAAYDQHRDAGWLRTRREEMTSDPGEARPTRREWRRRAGGHYVGQIRVLGERGLPHRRRQDHRTGHGSDVDFGNGPDALTTVMMVGDDMALDPGVGTCGKSGQGVPVGVGQPTVKLSGLTVGGTAA